MKLTKADTLMYAPLTEKEIQAEDEAIAEIRAGRAVEEDFPKKPFGPKCMPPLPAIRPTRHEQLIAAELLALKKDNEALHAKLLSLQMQLDVLAQELSRMQERGIR